MTLQQLLELDGPLINNLTNPQLREALKDATRITKQRLSNLDAARFNYTPARQIFENTKLPTYKEIDSMRQSELRHLLKQEVQFLGNQTSTVAGERERIRNFVRLSVDTKNKSNTAIENEITRKISKMGGYNELSEIFDLVHQAESLDPSIVYEMGSSEFIGSVIDGYIRGLDDPVQIKEYVREKIDRIQKENEQKSKKFGWPEDKMKKYGMRILSKEINKNLPRGMSIQKLSKLKKK